MHLTGGWWVVIICVTACLLILSIGIYHIPEDDESEEHEEHQDQDRLAGRHRRPAQRGRRR